MNYFTIELDGKGETYFDPSGDVYVYEHGVYDESSVLYGQPRRTFIDQFSTVAEAQKEYPNAEVLEESSYIDRSLSYLGDMDGVPFGRGF